MRSHGLIGSAAQRVEDDRLLTRRGHYVDDAVVPDLLHAAFVRSPLAHGRITAIDTAAAAALPGVHAVLTGADIAARTHPFVGLLALDGLHDPHFPCMATDTVRMVGDPLAIVVSESRRVAEDGCALVEVDYAPLPALTCAADALAPGAVQLWPTVHGPATPLVLDASRAVSPQFARQVRRDPKRLVALLASVLDLIAQHPHERPEGGTGDIGGAFGAKALVTREEIAIYAAARILRRSVKWTEDRNEHLLVGGQAREETAQVQLAVTDTGTVLGMKVDLVMDSGAYHGFPYGAPFFGRIASIMVPGPYRLQALRFTNTVAVTNKATYVPYRGPWAVETWIRERMLDVVARELGLTPEEIRLRNMIDAEELPRPMATGLPGLSPFGAREPARVELAPDGTVVVHTPQIPHGQSHETTLAQVAATELGVGIEQVRVRFGDTRVTPLTFFGTGGSRSAALAGGAVLASSRTLRRHLLDVAADLMEVSPRDLELVDGRVAVVGSPSTAVPLSAVAGHARRSWTGRSAAGWPRAWARCSTSTPRTTRTGSSRPGRSWTSSSPPRRRSRTSRSTTCRPRRRSRRTSAASGRVA